MNKFLQVIQSIWRAPDLRKKILFTLLVLLIFRIAAFIPTPGVDIAGVKSLFASNQLLSLLDVFSGGTLTNFSIIALGLNPYINASIIMQLMTMVFPKLEEMQKEGEYGRRKINQYTRYLTVPLAIVQAYAFIIFLSKSQGLVHITSPLQLAAMVVTLTAGTIFLMWLGELVTESGIGNGISVLIFAGILARLPVALARLPPPSTRPSS
jgi:preprotein translocase subunit SecY